MPKITVHVSCPRAWTWASISCPVRTYQTTTADSSVTSTAERTGPASEGRINSAIENILDAASIDTPPVELFARRPYTTAQSRMLKYPEPRPEEVYKLKRSINS